MATISPRRILLVVEDDLDLCQCIANVLEEEGYAVTTATDGAQGLECLQNLALPDLILLDLLMPVMDGRAFLKAMRRQAAWADIPVVVMTGTPLTHETRTELNVAHCLAKPFAGAELVATIGRHCARPEWRSP